MRETSRSLRFTCKGHHLHRQAYHTGWGVEEGDTEERMCCLEEPFRNQLTPYQRTNTSALAATVSSDLETGKSERESERNAEFPPDVSVMERPIRARHSNHMIARIILWFC